MRTYSKTIWNKILEAHELILNYSEFEILKVEFEHDKNDEKRHICGVKYWIRADAYIDYALGVCDAMDLPYGFDVNIDGEPEVYYLHTYLKK